MKNTYTNLRNIHAIIFYLNSQAKAAFTRMMGLESVKYGSILVYKNGVRINPYGDVGEDWLRLDRRKQQGYARYLGTRELLGRVEISGEQPGFIEVSSRDGGFVRNEYHDQLVDFTINLVVPLRRYVVEGIDWDRDTPVKTDMEIAEGRIEVIRKLTGSS